MLLIDTILICQALLGAFDNLWHHEWQARLPQQRGARRELALHAAREALYGALFLGLAWWAWHGLFALAIAIVLAVEVVITLADFLEEDRTRQLPPFERWLHTVLTVSYGLFVGVMGPVLLDWAAEPTALVANGRGLVSWWFTAMAAGVWAWSVRNALAVRRLGEVPAPAVLPVPRGAEAVLVTGGTGFVGRALVARLRAEGRRVIVLTRDVRQARLQFDPAVTSVGSFDEIAPETRIGAIVHLAGARVLGRPWTAARRRELVESRTRLSEALHALVRRLEQRPRVLVAASAVGYYGVPEAGTRCDEGTPPQPGVFQSDLCAAAEHEARRLEGLGLRVVRLRFGVVLGTEDGAYPMQALAARLGFGAVLGNGRQPVPWVHLEDAVGLVRWAMADPAVQGAVNAVAPEHCDQAGFSRALAASFGRRVWLRMPGAPLRAVAGEMATLLLDGQAVWPRRALAGGYRFRYATLRQALPALAAASSGRPAAACVEPSPSTTVRR
ncbi:TIGR01777 family oxidoreductase [Piscinibacter gummiphilus]|uniref:TIGR01777 family oxidoreductase n=1 Tax=Piscinibacter gummiphilus TaxID=946333 RepID=UPI000A26B4F0|nr:TIGR01777 family oxidoreductase [Piscinibacter gummiphilus]ATU67205.1 TIGR01777 family protein [Piscinibacter gummiphilus]GLS98097.1 epimerase [Piscinibacter gummiphilus]